jgi:DNA-binding MurR/RpiR family transcriptional regulator
MKDPQVHPVIKGIVSQLDTLTPKGKVLGSYIIQNPRKAVFMTTKELSDSMRGQRGNGGPVRGATGIWRIWRIPAGTAGLSWIRPDPADRVDLPGMKGPGTDLLHRVVFEEMNNLRQFYEAIDMKVLGQSVDLLQDSPAVYVLGSRVSYTFAYYMGWSLTKVRRGVHILKGSDSTAIDWLTNAPHNSLVTIITTSRYPNELIKLGKVARRLGHNLLRDYRQHPCVR